MTIIIKNVPCNVKHLLPSVVNTREREAVFEEGEMHSIYLFIFCSFMLFHASSNHSLSVFIPSDWKALSRCVQWTWWRCFSVYRCLCSSQLKWHWRSVCLNYLSWNIITYLNKTTAFKQLIYTECKCMLLAYLVLNQTKQLGAKAEII